MEEREANASWGDSLGDLYAIMSAFNTAIIFAFSVLNCYARKFNNNKNYNSSYLLSRVRRSIKTLLFPTEGNQHNRVGKGYFGSRDDFGNLQ